MMVLWLFWGCGFQNGMNHLLQNEQDPETAFISTETWSSKS